MKNIKAITLSLLSVMIGACNITNASNLQYNNNQFQQSINDKTIWEILYYVEDSLFMGNEPKPIGDINREIVKRIYNASNNKSLDTITKLVNKIIDKSNDHMKKVRQDYKYLNHLTQDEVSKILIGIIAKDIADTSVKLFMPGKEPIDDINRGIVTRIYEISNDKSTDTIKKLVNKTIKLYNNEINIINTNQEEFYKTIDQLWDNQVKEILILNRLENYENTTVRSVAKEFELPYKIVQEIYFKYNKLAECCNKLIYYPYEDINSFLNTLKEKIKGSNIGIEDIRYIAYKMDILGDIAKLSKNIQLNYIEHNMLINNIYAFNYSIPEITKKTGIPQYKLMEIYLRNDIMARIAYDTITDFGNKKNETTTWKNFLETFVKIAAKKYYIKYYIAELDKTNMKKILFKLGESDNIKFYE